MPSKTQLTSKFSGISGGGRSAARSCGEHTGSRQCRRDVTRSARLVHHNEFESSSTSSFKTSGSSSQRTGEGPCRVTGNGRPDRIMLTNSSSSSDAILKRFESIMGRISPSGDHSRWPLHRGQRQPPPEAWSSRCNRHDSDSQPSRKHRGGGGGNGGGGGGGNSRGGYRGEGVKDDSSNRRSRGVVDKPMFVSRSSSSYTRSGEPSSQMAYQTAPSLFASASSESSVPAMSNRRGSKSQIVKVAVQCANTSNQQQAVRRRATVCDISLPPSPSMRRLRLSGLRSSRDQYLTSAAAHWDVNLPDQNHVYDEHGQRCEQKSRGSRSAPDEYLQHQMQSRQHKHRQQPRYSQSRSLYPGNCTECDFFEENKLLRNRSALRSQRDIDTCVLQKSCIMQGLASYDDGDLWELSPGTLQVQRPPKSENKAGGPRCPIRGPSKIYCGYAPLNKRATEGSRPLASLPPRSAYRQATPPGYEDDGHVSGEELPGTGEGDSRTKRRLVSGPDKTGLVALIDLIFDRFKNLDSRARRRSLALRRRGLSDEEDVFQPPPSLPDAEFRAGAGTEVRASRRRQKAAAGDEPRGLLR